MNTRSWTSLLLAAFVGLIAPKADAIRVPMPDLCKAVSAPSIPSAAPLDIVSIEPIGYAADGDCLDLVYLVEPGTYNRVFCIVKSPLGLATWEETEFVFKTLYGAQGMRFLNAFLKEGYISMEGVIGQVDIDYHGWAERGRRYELELEDDLNPVESAAYLWKGLQRASGNLAIRKHFDSIEDMQLARAAGVRNAARAAATGANLYLAGLTCLNEGADWAMAAQDLSEGHYSAALAFLPVISVGMTKSSRLLLKHGDEIVSALRPLENALSYVSPKYRRIVKEAFEGSPVAVRLTQDIKVYRRWGGTSGQIGSPWFALKPYVRSGNAKRYLALPAKNTAKHIDEFVIPADSIILIGKAGDKTSDIRFGTHAVGGGMQIYLPDPSVSSLLE